MRRPSAKPRHKVPAPQANGVAARLRPPPEARAGWRVACLRCARGCFKPGPRMGLIQEETGGGSGYDHPSPSIPLPVEGRGKPVATWPGILGALDANVTCCKTRHLHNVFLKSEALGWRRLGKLVRWDANSGAHGVTRPTAHGLVAMRWVVVGCGFKA